MKKQVCIRLSEDCIAIIDKQKGENFSQKIENMIYFCNRELSRIEKETATAEKRLNVIKEDISDCCRIFNRLQNIDCSLRQVESIVSKLTEARS